jgi:hypothetical protein
VRFEAIKGGPTDNQNYLWPFEYTLAEAGSPYLAAYGPDDSGVNVNNVYEVDATQVAAVPAPAAVWLLGSALMGLGAATRRKACNVVSQINANASRRPFGAVLVSACRTITRSGCPLLLSRIRLGERQFRVEGCEAMPLGRPPVARCEDSFQLTARDTPGVGVMLQ